MRKKEKGRAIAEGAVNLRPAPLFVRLALLGAAVGVACSIGEVFPWRVVGAVAVGLFGFPLSATVVPLLFGGGKMEVVREGLLIRMSFPLAWRGAIAGVDFGLLYLIEGVWGELCGGAYWTASWLALRIMERGVLSPFFEAASKVKSSAGAVWCALLSILAFAPFALPYLPVGSALWVGTSQGVTILALFEARWQLLRR